ncbi:hypothetical protein F5I97DRAFT_1879416 [Phlebopus sp. FC_14]|nr:hypothetical protein F5I97DRAFT_1879416 [Phlebopus sp. FC_14]
MERVDDRSSLGMPARRLACCDRDAFLYRATNDTRRGARTRLLVTTLIIGILLLQWSFKESKTTPVWQVYLHIIQGLEALWFQLFCRPSSTIRVGLGVLDLARLKTTSMPFYDFSLAAQTVSCPLASGRWDSTFQRS